ncbi:Heparanase, partial [Exaiptasia diaphana]
VDKRFLSIAIDTNLLRHDWYGLKVCDKLTTLAKGLQPAYLRIGGTAADFLTFDNNGSNQKLSHGDEGFFDDPAMEENLDSEMNFTISKTDLDKVHEIASKGGWDVVFDLNVLKRSKNGSWDPTNPLEIMHYVREKGYNFAWQLGNEPNHLSKFGRNMTAPQLGKDFSKLREILHNDPSLGTIIVGPDANALEDQTAKDYLKEFLESGGDVVNAVTWHHYYVNGRTAKIEDFYKATILDGLVAQLKEVSDIVVSTTPPNTKPWIGETSSAYGGGARGLSDRYVAGFMWLDKLGLSARLNEDIVIRQTLFGGRYALLDSDMNPNPVSRKIPSAFYLIAILT